jgi:hypothetical protein
MVHIIHHLIVEENLPNEREKVSHLDGSWNSDEDLDKDHFELFQVVSQVLGISILHYLLLNVDENFLYVIDAFFGQGVG